MLIALSLLALIGSLLLLGAVGLARIPIMTVVWLVAFSHFYVARALLAGVGAVDLFPADLFDPSRAAGDLVGANLAVAAFLLAISAGVVGAGHLAGTMKPAVPLPLSPAHERRMTLAAHCWGFAGLVVGAFLVTRFGGVGGSISAARLERSVGSINYLRMFSGIAIVLYTGLAFSRQRTQRRAWPFALLALVHGGLLMLWGTRTGFGLALALLLLLRVASDASVDGTLRQRLAPMARATVLALLVVLPVLYGLRLLRYSASGQEATTAVTESGVVGNISLATNQQIYDAVVLAARDREELSGSRARLSLTNSALRAIPAPVRPLATDSGSVGQAFRQHYEPTTDKGWPLGGVGEWVLLGGIAGAAIGGLLTGGLGVALTIAMNRARWITDAAAVSAVAFMSVRVGFEEQTLDRLLTWALPLGFTLVATRVARARAPREVSQEALTV